MSREKLKEHYAEIIRNQLKIQNPEGTVSIYHKLLENEYEEDSAVDVLAFYMENMVVDMLKHEEDYDEQKWNHMLNGIRIYNLEEADKVTAYDMKKITAKLKKEFGSIKHGDEEPYLEGLAAYENNLQVMVERYQLNSRQLRTIVEIWMLLLYGSLHQKTYDFCAVADLDLIEIAKSLEWYSNPIINPKLYDTLKAEDIAALDKNKICERSVTMAFRLLIRIHESMDFWEKKLGSNGYLNYLSNVEAFE